MRNIKIQKEDNELFIALKDYLQILKEDIESAITNKPYRIRVIVAILRLLICDRSNRGGLLTHLVDKYGFDGKITTDSKKYSLQEYKDEIIFKSSGSQNYEISRCKVITNVAQQDGLSHEDIHRTYENFAFNTIMEMGKTTKTNPRVGIFVLMGYQVLTFGENFLKLSG